MKAVGLFEAKTHLSDLVERVAKGERITLTRYGKSVAVLAPADAEPAPDLREAVAWLKRYRRRHPAGRGGVASLVRGSRSRR